MNLKAHRPAWMVSNEESVLREVEEARRMTPSERLADVIACCATLATYWGLPGYPQRIREAVDPLPESSRAALARLRTQYRATLT